MRRLVILMTVLLLALATAIPAAFAQGNSPGKAPEKSAVEIIECAGAGVAVVTPKGEVKGACP